MGKRTNMNKVSVIIPYMQSDPDKPAVLNRLLDSLEGKGADEILVIENWKEGYAVPINFGLSQAKGDYLVVMNDDLVLDCGFLDQLPDPNAVTSPLIDGNEQPFWGCCFCIPRWVYEMVGGLDERYRISYFDDDAYEMILRKNNIPLKSMPLVNFWNKDGGGRTLHSFSDHDIFFHENKRKFIEQWGAEPQQLRDYHNKFNKMPSKNEAIVYFGIQLS